MLKASCSGSKHLASTVSRLKLAAWFRAVLRVIGPATGAELTNNAPFSVLVLLLKLPSLVYWTQTLCRPWVRLAVERRAKPPLSGRGQPKTWPSTRNWTDPAGTALEGGPGPTVTAKVTFEPVGVGLAELLKASVEPAALTVRVPLLVEI